MSWTSSFFVVALTGVLGILVAGFVTAACGEWFHVSNREGGAGYLMIAGALVGGIVAVVLGLVFSRVVAGMPEPGFLKALGYSCGSVLALGGIALGLGWLKADFAPKIDGQSLALAIEMRCPKDFTLPTEKDKYGTYACVYVPRGRMQARGEVELARAKQVDGRWLITSVVPLNTSSSDKYLEVSLGTDSSISFWLPLRRHPRRSDMEWGEWRDSSWNAGEAQPPPEKRFNLRYKVQLVTPPPPGPTHADEEARAADDEQAKFAALGAESPIQAWLPYTQYGATDARRAIAIKHIVARPNYVAELAALMVATEDEDATGAFFLIPHLPSPQPALLPPMAAAGRHIAGMIRNFNATSPEQDPNQRGADSVAARFGAWSDAARALREKSGGDFTAELADILTLSRVRTDSSAMRGSVRRVASYWLKQWANIDPLPGDPPPR